MTAQNTRNLQDTFLSYVQAHRTPLTVFLTNGVRLQGVVVAFDNFCVSIERDGHTQMVYKQAISTISPLGPVQLYDSGEEPREPSPQREPVVVVKRSRPFSRSRG